MNFGATLEGAVKLPPNMKNLSEGMSEASAGARLIYIDPNNTSKLYLEAGDSFNGQINDFQNQKILVKKSEEKFTIGGEVKVYEGSIVRMEAGEGNHDWGKSKSLKAGLSEGKFAGEVGYEKKSSEFERFIPSSEKIEVGIGYKGGPKWEVDVIGSKVVEKYKDAESSARVNAEVKLKIFLW